MIARQIQVSISQQLNDLLRSKADRLGLSVTELVKFFIFKAVEDEDRYRYARSGL